MATTDISQVATLLRPVSTEVFNGKGKLCLSANYLSKLNAAFEANITEDINTSFHIVQTSNSKNNLMRDVQFLLDLIQRTISLKVIPDVIKDCANINITRFQNIKVLEIHKLDVRNVVGIQKLRSQIQELTCCHSLSSLGDILDECGGDTSQRYSWNELKKANFSHNGILEIDDSFEYTLSLHTLDLTHNQLSKVDFINLLPNLKHLNLSYNKLDRVPRFKGQVCTRLQVLVLKNNFIEDITGLLSLSNVVQLDLSQNCLLDHKTLLSVSHLTSLQWLNLQGNPFSFHPQHRNLTCNYLNKNTSTVKFVLDNMLLGKSEKSLTGSLYPILQTAQLSTTSTNSLESVESSVQEKTRKIRNVKIEEENAIKEEVKPIVTPPLSSQHLEIKRQVEQLRQEYGESWLYRDSGLLVQDVLGFEKTSILSSTPYESAIDSLYMDNTGTANFTIDSTSFKTTKDESNPAPSSNNDFQTANDDSTIFNTTNETQDDISDASDGEDICSGGEECIYLAINNGENTQVFVVVTDTHISERDVTTSKEKARWHINTVRGCDKLEETANIFKLDFDTLRRDRKQRIYELDQEEAESFYNSIRNKIVMQTPVQEKKMQCMKCSELFPKKKTEILYESSVTCPNCKSNLVVESI